MGYTWTKLHMAVHCLVQAGSQRERLCAAISEHLICLRPSDLPMASRAESATIIDSLCLCRNQQPQVSVKGMIDAINDDHVSVMIDAIMNLYDAISRHEQKPAAQGKS